MNRVPSPHTTNIPTSKRNQSTGAVDLRIPSPLHLALVGVGLWLAGLALPGLPVLVPIGLGALVIAGVGQLLRPRTRTMYWRGRNIELEAEPSLGGRLYRTVFR